LQLYAAMVLSIDENVARILEALDRLELTENTVVMFISDNGPSYSYNVGWPEHWERQLLGTAGELSGRKGNFGEGGIRVPYLIRWPAALPAGKVYEEPISTLDVYPTFCAAAGVGIPEEMNLDGVNLLPYLQGEEGGAPHDQLYWFQSDRGALREGDWKLHVATANRPPRLHNLKEDPGELRDLAEENVEVYERLQNDWKTFAAELPLSWATRYEAAGRAFREGRDDPPRPLHQLQEGN
jgi:arylsulfatase A-like enzyme